MQLVLSDASSPTLSKQVITGYKTKAHCTPFAFTSRIDVSSVSASLGTGSNPWCLNGRFGGFIFSLLTSF